MNEFIEKLIGRLEEIYNRNDKTKKKAYEEQDWEKFDLFTHRCEGICSAIEIVSQLAEEYKHCTLCYLQSPCEYQNENAMMPNELLAHKNGWIPCSERLPEKDMWCLATFESGNVDKIKYLASQKWWNGEMGDNRVIAWQPLPEPYIG